MKSLSTMKRKIRTEKHIEKGWLYGYRNTDVEIVVGDGHAQGLKTLLIRKGSLYSESWDISFRKWNLSSNKFVDAIKRIDKTFVAHENFFYALGYREICKYDLSSKECITELKGH